MALVEVKVPDIGDFDEVAVIELLVKVGDTVKAEQSLITVESDKASMEIPSSTAGVVKEMRVALGDKVKEGSVVLVVEAAGEAAAPAPAAAPAAAAPAPTPAAAPVAAPAAAPAAVGPVEVRVPDIGDFKDVAVIEVFVKPGDSIKVEQSLITVESDKASMEIPSSHAGVLKELKVKVGDTVNIGDLLAILEGAAGAAVGATGAAAGAAGAEAAGAAAAPSPSNTSTTEPCLTLSPSLTLSSLTTPAWEDGISIEALSDSTVMSDCSALTVSPGLTSNSITATSSKSPMSGT